MKYNTVLFIDEQIPQVEEKKKIVNSNNSSEKGSQISNVASLIGSEVSITPIVSKIESKTLNTKQISVN